MIFSSYKFLFIFLPLTLSIYFLFNRFKLSTIAKYWLALCSLIFYWQGSPNFILFFIGSVMFNYIFGMILSNCHNKKLKKLNIFFLIIGIIANVVFLGYFKYADFVINNVNFIFKSSYDLLHIKLPIGISFFTFQLIAYLVDSYKGDTREYSFLNYLLFITFFPQLIVGPIVHHKEVVPQYENEQKSFFNYRNFSIGLFLFSLGCAKKILMAEPLTGWAQAGFAAAKSMDMLHCWMNSLSFTLSYYFDLSGYADMAIGLGYMFNIKIPINFNSPYKARNFADYWRRWHITLSRFLGDYIFRSVYKKGGGSARFYLAIMVTFLVSGIWHGAGWTFVVWGIFNGIFVVFSHMMERSGKKLPYFFAWFLTFTGVVFARILFVSRSFSDAFHVFKTLFNISTIDSSFLSKIVTSRMQILYIIIGLCLTWFFPNSTQIKNKFKPNIIYSIITLILLFISILSMNKVSDFLYFQF